MHDLLPKICPVDSPSTAPNIKSLVFSLVGRTNTGKSRLYNALCGRPEALVSAIEHLTRDWRENVLQIDDWQVKLRDTAGMEAGEDALSKKVEALTQQQIMAADVILFVVDARAGLTEVDAEIARRLRSCGKPVVLVINKMDTTLGQKNWTEFSQLGFQHSALISAERLEGFSELYQAMQTCCQQNLPDQMAVETNESADAAEPKLSQQIVVCGLSNSGKSTLINRLLDNERLLVHDQKGTTREAIGQSFQVAGYNYHIFDTCGFVRRGEILQYLADIKTTRLMNDSDLLVYMFDARAGIVREDLRKIEQALELGQNPILVANKSDLISLDERKSVLMEIRYALRANPLAVDPLWLSAKTGKGTQSLLQRLQQVLAEASMDLSTNRLTRLLYRATEQNKPPSYDNRVIRLRYAHQGGRRPLKIVIHGKQTERLGATYQRYLTHFFVKHLHLKYTLPRLSFQTGENPYHKPKRTSPRG